MPTYVELPEDLNEVDVIVVGGGTAGSVIASRLSDAASSLSVLIIESGGSNQDLPQVRHPALYKANFAPDSRTFRPIIPTLENGVGEHAAFFTGDVLGGSSSVNGLIYTRAQRDDFDGWNMKGWTADEVLPYLQKFETYHGNGDQAKHGQNGSVHVSRHRYNDEETTSDFVSVMNHLGYSEATDLQDLDSNNQVSRTLRYVSPETGHRQDSASTYLLPRLADGKHQNLHLLLQTQVIKVLVDRERKATGVVVRCNPKFGGTDHSPRTIRARQLVILSAGTLATPTILERSGIGSLTVLEKAGVDVIQELPGVGNNYQDHQMIVYTYKSSVDPVNTTESILDGSRDVGQLITTNHDFLSWNGIDASAKIRPTEEEVDELGPRFRELWDRDFKDFPNKPLALLFFVNGILADPRALLPGAFFTLAGYTAYSYARGSMHITGPSLDDTPEFKTGYLLDPEDGDLKTHAWLYKKQREVARRMEIFRGETHQHPSFDIDSEAATIADGDKDTAKVNIKYSPADNDAIETYVKSHVGTAFHGLGTCRMAPLDQLGVVDERLSVYGITGLKVADLSFVPSNVSGNTMSTALMIGERAADLFIEELGLE